VKGKNDRREVVRNMVISYSSVTGRLQKALKSQSLNVYCKNKGT
jgi:hypothetical protein